MRKREKRRSGKRGIKTTHRPRLVSRNAIPISPARFSRAAARISDGALGWFCIFVFAFRGFRETGRRKRGKKVKPVQRSFLFRLFNFGRRCSFEIPTRTRDGRPHF